MDFKECMDFIGSYSRLGGRVTDLSRARELMERIGNPEKRLKFVHIAGTNGKGSTLEYIANALVYSGYKTGKFTSPYVTHYTDRIRINDREIDEKSLGEICEYVSERVADKEYSQFEITMAIAMLWYVREQCDIIVLETGIGGLLDSTNVIPPPLLSVITSISLDHTDILGDTVEKIAEQKAGIIKENSITVLSMDNPESVTKIVKNAAEKKSGLFVQPVAHNLKYLESGSDGIKFIYKKKEYKTAMAGRFQMFNAVTAIEACYWLKTSGFKIPDENVQKAIATSRINARLQYIHDNPTVVIDGGHNPAAVKYLFSSMTCERQNGHKIYSVAGISDSKDLKANVRLIAGFSDKMFCVDDFSANAVSTEKLVELADEYAEAEASCLSEAIEKAKELALENNGIVVICGSLYLASEFLNKYAE